MHSREWCRESIPDRLRTLLVLFPKNKQTLCNSHVKPLISDKQCPKDLPEIRININFQNSTTLVYGLFQVVQLSPINLNGIQVQYHTQPIDKCGAVCGKQADPVCLYKLYIFNYKEYILQSVSNNYLFTCSLLGHIVDHLHDFPNSVLIFYHKRSSPNTFNQNPVLFCCLLPRLLNANACSYSYSLDINISRPAQRVKRTIYKFGSVILK